MSAVDISNFLYSLKDGDQCTVTLKVLSDTNKDDSYSAVFISSPNNDLNSQYFEVVEIN